MMATMGAERERVPATDVPAAIDRDTVLSALHRECFAQLVGLARLLLDEQGQAEEVVQEAFARTYEGWSRLRDREDPLPYLRRAVVNLARGGLRRRLTARAFRPVRPADAPSAEAGALANQRRDQVIAAVSALPRRQHECIVLRFYVDCTTADIARTLGISEGSVKQHLHRASAALAVELGEQPW